MALGLHIQIEEEKEKNIIRLEGRIDAMSSPQLEKEITKLLEKGRDVLLVDFSRVDYLSSAGMRLLLSITKKLKAKQGKCLFFSFNEEVLEIVKMAGFEKILNIYPNEKAALAACE